MKKILLFLSGLVLATTVYSQTATNFIATDCNGNQHNLFNELDSGKVIILVWVMPCGGCIGAAQTAANIAEDYGVSDSGRVFCYIADDYADASCLTINSWCTNNNITRVTTFCDSAVSMAPYGTNGMPKVIVLGGGTAHGIYFNEDNQFADDSLGIKIAVDSALADANSVPAINVGAFPASIYPNPSAGTAVLKFFASANETITVDITSVNGKAVRSSQHNVLMGAVEIPLSVNGLASGAYLIRINSSRGVEVVTLDVISPQ